MTVFGVPFGANIPHQGEKVKAGNPTSAAVGIFGAMLKRSLAVTRYALIPPDRTCIKLVVEVHTRSMCPARQVRPERGWVTFRIGGCFVRQPVLQPPRE